MDFNIDFNLVRTQKLLLIPQLKQALEILEMNSCELFHYLEDQLVSNPVLDEATVNIPADATDESHIHTTDEEYPDPPMPERITAALSLKEHLLIQMDHLFPEKTDHRIGEYLVDNTDDNGYLTVDIREVAAFFDVPDAKVIHVLDNLQALDPPGICARNLSECLLLQLKQSEENDEDAMLVVDQYLDQLAEDDTESVAALSGITEKRVREIFDKVKSLEPRPGREFYSNDMEKPSPPDVFIREMDGGFQVLPNAEAFPDICMSHDFTSDSSHNLKEEEADYFHEKVKNAVWLIKCLEQREDIILAVAQKLCMLEQEFFSKGLKAVKILDKAAFAASLDMHESILEKALRSKYLQCRWGVFEFGRFFDDIAY